MKISIAENAGFCFGVRRAIDNIENMKKLNKKNIYVLGKLIHNPQVVKDLENQGVKSIDNTEDIDKDCTIVITAHGVPDKKISEIKEKGFEVIDLTCPLVKKVHNITKQAEKQGYKVIIFGDKDHIEVKGIKGNLKDAIIISNLNDIKKLDPKSKYFLVSQTTQNVTKFNSIVEYLKKLINNMEVCDTVCMPTKKRQSSSVELAKKSDLMIVIGGKISANTKKLAQRCSEFAETKHIETEKELKKEWFKGKNNVGITAGASTPDYIIKKVIDRIKNEFS